MTEQDIANYLASTPDFFERHATLLANIRLTSLHDGRAIGLSERQVQLLRERLDKNNSNLNKLLELGRENVGLANKLHQWMLQLLIFQNDPAAAQQLAHSLQTIFNVPQVLVSTSAAARAVMLTLSTPRCGLSSESFFLDSRLASELATPQEAVSMALIPLPDVGVLVLASPDPARFSADMDTEFLLRLGELAHAALLGRV